MKDFPWIIDLQLFADDGTGEKTEQATPRKRAETRKKGQVYKSNDLNSAFILIAGSMTMVFSFPYMVKQTADFSRFYFGSRTLEVIDLHMVSQMIAEVALLLGKILLPVGLACFLTALVINLVQVGFLFSPEALSFKLNRLDPVQGFKQKFSKRALVELIKSLLKVGITGYIVLSVVQKDVTVIPRLLDMSSLQVFQILKSVFLEIAIKVGIVFICIGIIDYLYQRYEYEKNIRMSKYEIKQEYKQTEGDPLIKSRQKQRQREAAMRRMMQEVPKADVVITNPTHYAVALKYDADKMDAPIVVAKGAGHIALKIRELALEHDVIVKEEPPLARWLYQNVEIGWMVPPEMFQAVAEVLAFVYRQKKVRF